MGQTFGHIAQSVGKGGSVLGGIGDSVTKPDNLPGIPENKPPQPSTGQLLLRGLLGGLAGYSQSQQQPRNPFYGGY